MSHDPIQMSARALAKAVQSGALAPQAVAEAHQELHRAVEPQVRAFVSCLDRPSSRGAGLLAGVPFGVKDVIETADLPTTYGSQAYVDWQPCRDAPVVHFARQAGAMVMGKTVTTEFATAAPGPTVNPFDVTRTPGGSSSGSAAALATGQVKLAYGTQTSGSTIRPASYCGVVGYKASLGVIDRMGVKAISGSLDVVGLMARDCRDVALLAAVAMRRGDLLGLLEGPAGRAKMGIFLPQDAVIDSADSCAVVERAAGVWGEVTARAVPPWWGALGRAQEQVFGWEVSACLATDRDLHWDQLAPRSHGFLDAAARWSFADWLEGLAARDAALARIDDLFGDSDILMTQAAPAEAQAGLATTGPAAFNIRWSLLGCPAISVPAGLGPNGLPVGVQLVARPGQDAQLLAAAIGFEEVLRQRDIPARPDRLAVLS